MAPPAQWGRAPVARARQAPRAAAGGAAAVVLPHLADEAAADTAELAAGGGGGERKRRGGGGTQQRNFRARPAAGADAAMQDAEVTSQLDDLD
jgi:hypothetical protein